MDNILYYLKTFIKVNILPKKLEEDTKRNHCYIFMCADYPNMGDIAITVAQKKFLEKLLKDYQITCIKISESYYYLKDIKKRLKQNDIITIIGGGNITDLYIAYERERKFVIHYFQKNKIISFPETISFSDSKKGIREAKSFQSTCNKNQNLTILVREEQSLKYCENKKIENVKLTPDIVFSLDNQYPIVNRDNNITLCFRNDKEKKSEIIEKVKRNELINQYHLREMDTLVDFKIDFEKREEQFEKFLADFSNTKLLITDRLHGMIFAYITNTPCIVFDNSNKKISSTYFTWLKNQNFIIFEDSYGDNKMSEDVRKLLNLKEIQKQSIMDGFKIINEKLGEKANER